MENYYLAVAYTLAGLFGLCVGSFLNVVIYRVPRGMSIAHPSSHCTACDYTLRWYDNIPVVSYLLLGGKCRKCKTHISFRYTAVELLNACLWLLSVHLFWQKSIPLACAYALACSLFLCVFFVDLECGIIPDRFQLLLLLVGIAATVFDTSTAWYSHLIGALAGFLLFFLVAFLFERITGREGLGGGDVKLVFVAGLLLGWEKLLLALLIATVPAAIVMPFLVKKTEKEKNSGEEETEAAGTFPFGPFLVTGFAVAMLVGTPIITWYLSVLGL